MSAGELTGWLAAALTLLTFSMQSMLALRLAAVASNLSFIAYGAVTHLEPVLVLHLLLLPCNLFRLCQLLAARRPRAPAVSDTSPNQAGRDWLIVRTSDSRRFFTILPLEGEGGAQRRKGDAATSTASKATRRAG